MEPLAGDAAMLFVSRYSTDAVVTYGKEHGHWWPKADFDTTQTLAPPSHNRTIALLEAIREHTMEK